MKNMMTNNGWRSALTLAGGLLCGALVGCGGGSSTTTSEGGQAAAGGEQGPVSASGTTISQEAENRWAQALEAYNTAREGGLTEAECTQVISRFENANSAQGGRFTEAVFMIGLTHDQCGHADQARQFYDQALTLSPRFCGARVAAGLEHYRNNRIPQARQEFERAVREDAQCTEGYVNLAILQRRDGNEAGSRDSLQNLRRALAIRSDYLPAFNQMALLYYEQAIRRAGAAGVAGGTAQLSGTGAGAAAAASSSSTSDARQRAQERSDRQMLDLAEVVCRQAQIIDGNYAAIYNTWGLINVRQGNIIAGLAKFERAFNLDPTFFEAYMNFGELTLSFRGYADANAAFERATQLRPTSYDAWLGLGAARRGMGNVDGAQEAYERAQQIDATRPESYFNIGLLWQDYRDGAVASLRQSTTFYQQFVQRAGSQAGYAAAVESVTRRCQTQQGSQRRRRWQRGTCRPGRLQQIEEAIVTIEQMQQIQAQAAEMQRQAEAQEAAQRAAEQQAAPAPAPATPPPAQ